MIVRSILKGKTINEVATITKGMSLIDVAKLLQQKRIGAVPVVDADKALVGIISERDLARALALYANDTAGLKVDDLMTTALVTCGPDDHSEKLMEVMTNSRIRHLPVLEDGKLIGIISIGDVVKARIEEVTMQVDSLRDYVMAGR